MLSTLVAFSVPLLVAANAFFVMIEFALVSVRWTRIEQLVTEGRPGARLARALVENLSDSLAATQLGITLASLALGWLGETTFAELFEPWFASFGPLWGGITSHAAASALAFVLITTMHIVFGELVPRSAALHRPEQFVTWAVFPLMGLRFVLRPFAVILNAMSRSVLKLFGIPPSRHGHRPHSHEELRILVEESHRGGALPDTEQRMLTSALDFSNKKVDAIMTPRTEMVGVPEDIGLPALLEFIREDQHTRLPVYRGTIDQIVGTLNIKHLMPFIGTAAAFELRAVMREPFFVPAMKPLGALLKEMQHKVEHIAIVVDEFGGTVGLVTMEDLLEEIVGEIFDEFDVEKAAYETLPDGDMLLDGRTNVDHVNATFDLALPSDDYNTIGGLVFGTLGRVPKAGDLVDIGGVRLAAEEVRARRVTRVRLVRGKNVGPG